MPPPTGTDRRYGYIRVLAKELLHSRAQYQEKHWRFCCRWIAQIGIAEVTLPSRHAVQQLTGLGDGCIKLLKQAEDEKGLNIAPPKRGYCSAARRCWWRSSNTRRQPRGKGSRRLGGAPRARLSSRRAS